MSERLHALSLIDALAALRSGTTASESLTRARLDRNAATDVNVQAWTYLATAGPDAARRSNGERAAGSATGLRAAWLPFGGLL